MNERLFPLIYSGRAEEPLRARLPSVPWGFIAPHEEQARRNHDQTLETLAARGGLGPAEALAVVEGRPLRTLFHTGRTWLENETIAVEKLIAMVADWEDAEEEFEAPSNAPIGRCVCGAPVFSAFGFCGSCGRTGSDSIRSF
jgi:hypothetical protein